MPYTTAQLTQFYATLSGGAALDAMTSAAISTAASQNATGAITDLQAFQVVANSLQVRATSDVAVTTYALYTGATPSQAGVNYLVNNPGSGYNTNYYNGATGTAANPSAGGFNLENRYYNAALNLAATTGVAGNAAFVAQYGALSLAQTVATAYSQIIGTAAVGATAASAAITAITAQIPYFQAVAAARAPAGANQDIATKAVITAYILEEGVKADVGAYARALDSYNSAVALGTATFNTGLLTTYGVGGASFNPAFAPLTDGQTFAASSAGNASFATVGVAGNGVATVNAGANATIVLTGDVAANNGQLVVNVANAASTAGDVLNLTYSGQTIATAASVIAANVEVVNLNASAIASAPAGTALSLDLQDASLVTLNITGNERVIYSAPLYAFLDGSQTAGSLRTINASQAAAPVNIDISGTGSASNGSASGGVTVLGTTGADTVAVRNYATVTGGGGADTIVVYAPTSLSSVSSVTDDHAGVVVAFAGLPTLTFRGAALTTTSVQSGLDAAAAAGPGVVSWFQSGGDTYLVADNSATTTFQAGSDFVIRLVGLHNLAASTVSGGAVVLGG